MRLSHAYDERENLLHVFRKGYTDADDTSSAARARFAAIAEDLERHTAPRAKSSRTAAAARSLSNARGDLEALVVGRADSIACRRTSARSRRSRSRKASRT